MTWCAEGRAPISSWARAGTRHSAAADGTFYSRAIPPVKAATIDAVRIAYAVVLAYCRDLWWIAAETASVCTISAADDPEGALMAFLQSTYVASAELAGWDREKLELPEIPKPR